MKILAVGLAMGLSLLTNSASAAPASTPPNAKTGAQLILDIYDEGDADTKQTIMFYVSGVLDGIIWTNTAAAYYGKDVYCPPAKLVIEPEQALSIVRAAIVNDGELAAQPFGMVAVMGFRETFACTESE